MKKNIFLVPLVLLTLAACSNVKQQTVVRSGIYKSIDKGNSWTQKSALVTTGGLGNISTFHVAKMFMDPHDNNAIYVTSKTGGMVFTYNGGENWMVPPQMASGIITDLKVDTKDKCIIYASIGNRVMKTTDCNRSYSEIYVDTRKVEITKIDVSTDNNKEVYITTTKGDIIKSADAGRSWNTIYNHRSEIIDFTVDPNDSSTMYTATAKDFYKSDDGGFTWESLSQGLKKYSKSLSISHILMNPSQSNSLFIVNKYGILRSDDGGDTWIAYDLITPPLSTTITSIGVSQQNKNELYYTTSSTFYKSEDGGKNWIVRRLPTQAQPASLLVDPVNPSIIYMGTFIPQK